MKLPRFSLTKQERLLLINLYESDEYKALKKLMAIQQLQIAQACIFAEDMKQVGDYAGQVKSLAWLESRLEQIHKQHKKGLT